MIEQIGFWLFSGVVLMILGLIVAFSPTIVITEITTLIKSKDPYKYSLALVAGLATAVIVVTYVAVSNIDPTAKIDLPYFRQAKLSDIFDFILGVGLIALGTAGLHKMSKPSDKPKTKSVDEKIFTVKKLYLFGFFKMLTSISSIFAILVGAKFINKYMSDTIESHIATLFFVCVSLLPFVFLIVARHKKPETFIAVESRSKFPFFYRWKRLIFVSCIFIGVLILIV